MSGIVGLLMLDGQRAELATLRAMLDTIAHRAQEGAGFWSEGAVGLGLAAGPAEPRPLGGARLRSCWGGVVLCLDARIDNRDQLSSIFAIPGALRDTVTDEELVVLAYDRWGKDCPRHLVGDFAFALWDPQRHRLFCARDHFGVKPLYYHFQSGRRFACASEMRPLLALEGVSRRLDETWLADFLEDIYEDRENTPYEGIRRLPPAHSLVATTEGVTVSRYWTVADAPDVRLGSDAAYEEAFRAVFTESVRCRLRPTAPIASTLSGGLDSSSVTCVARDEMRAAGRAPLRTVSQVYDEIAACDERPYIEAVLAGGDLDPLYVNCDRVAPLEDTERFVWHLEQPTYAQNLALIWAMTREAAAREIGVILTGLHGDNTLSHGTYHLADLLRSGRLSRLRHEVQSHARNWDRSPWWSFRTFAAKPLLPDPLLRTWSWVRRRPAAPEGPRKLTSLALARRVGLEERRRVLYATAEWQFRSAHQLHRLEVSAGITTSALEASDHVGAAFGVEFRHPYLDRRLVEYCVGMPSEQKFQDGWPRSIARRSLAGVLPEQVRWRLHKTLTSAWYSRALWEREHVRLEELVRRPEVIEPYVDVAAMRATFERYAATGEGVSARALWKPLMLAAWLQTEPARDRNREGSAIAVPQSMQFPAALA